MERILKENSLQNEALLRQCLAEGYIYYVEGDYDVAPECDEFGCPVVNSNVHLFDNEMDANKFARNQHWPFNNNVHPDVCDLSKRVCDLHEFDCDGEQCAMNNDIDNMFNGTNKAHIDSMITKQNDVLQDNEDEISELSDRVEILANAIRDLEDLIETDGQFGKRVECDGSEELSNEEVLDIYNEELSKYQDRLSKAYARRDNLMESIHSHKGKSSRLNDDVSLLQRMLGL